MIQFANIAIDTVQGFKSTLINSFVTEDAYKKPLQAFIDAQTSFAKAAAQSVYDVTTKLGEDITKFDAQKAFSFSK